MKPAFIFVKIFLNDADFRKINAAAEKLGIKAPFCEDRYGGIVKIEYSNDAPRFLSWLISNGYPNAKIVNEESK